LEWRGVAKEIEHFEEEVSHGKGRPYGVETGAVE